MRRFAALLLGLAVITGSCAPQEPATPQYQTQTPKDAVIDILQFAGSRDRLRERPASALGVYVTLFLSQSIFLPFPVNAALQGILALVRLSSVNSDPNRDQAFTLLQEFGTALAIDVPDMLNRSSDRITSLTRYADALEVVTVRAEGMRDELKRTDTTLKEKARTEQATVRTLTREISDALRDKEYGFAAEKQPALTEAEAALASTQARQRMNADLIRRYEDMIKIAKKRSTAISANREILISGLKVVDVPGIEDLDLVREPPRTR